MSDDNQREGEIFYRATDPEGRSWMARQRLIWPKRADERCTTNISFLYGGVLAHRVEHGCDPVMSDDYRSHVTWLDRHPTP